MSEAKTLDFEQALAELEGLVARLERGDLPLDEALKTFERGVELTRLCQGSLKVSLKEHASSRDALLSLLDRGPQRLGQRLSRDGSADRRLIESLCRAIVAGFLAQLALPNERFDILRLAIEERVDGGFVGHEP